MRQFIDLRNTPLYMWVLYWGCSVAGYLVAVQEGYVPGCFPHIEGCTSISRTGRHGTSFFIFKALMIPAATLTIVYWSLTYEWLKQINKSTRMVWLIPALGIIGALFLILYLTFLGSDGDVYRSLRRYGTNVFFLFTFIAHGLLAWQCWHEFRWRPLVTVKVVLCFAVLVELLAFVILKSTIEDSDWIENSSEWRSASILTLLPIATWVLWRQTGFRITHAVRP